MKKTYSEMMLLPSFEKRLEYLKIPKCVGEETFGSKRYLNQNLYHHSPIWKSIRKKIIVRDNGCDLSVPGLEIFGRIIVHHINPITVEDILRNADLLFDPENLVCVSKETHDCIHYSSDAILPRITVRHQNDTCPWKY